VSGRIRTIKPELLEDAVTAGLSDPAFRVFIGMILLADDYGNLRAEAKYLEGQIYWSAIPEKSVRDSCGELESLVTFYRVRGQLYAHIKGWDKHQKVQHPGKPRVPNVTEKDSGESHESLTPDLRPPTSDHDPDRQHAPEAPADSRVSGKSNQGTRLAEDWQPSEGSRAVAAKHALTDAELESAVTEFKNYWLALPGSKGRKLDWDRTFQNRIAENAGRKRRLPASGAHPAARHQPITQRGTERSWMPKETG
jgi:hypothetical protein